MATRVLARIPEITAGPAAAPGPPAPPEHEPQPVEVAATRASWPMLPDGEILPARKPFQPKPGRRDRTLARPRLPLASILALAAVTIGIWSLVAYREADRRDPRQPSPRMAATGKSSVVAAETTIR